MSKKHYDFAGWATKNNIRCTDGRTIMHGAFSADNGKRVPLVWNHQHDNVRNVLGHADLEERPEGVYAYCSFNNTEHGQDAKDCVAHGDIVALSIFANQLKQDGANVVHGAIREVSLVLAGANRGAVIDAVLAHGELSEDSAEIRFVGYDDIEIHHSEDLEEDEDEFDEDELEESEEDEEEFDEEPDDEEDEEDDEELQHADSEDAKEDKDAGDGETVADVMKTLTDKQRRAVAIIIEQITAESKGEASVKHSDDAQNDKISEDSEETIGDVLETLTDKQRKVVEYLIGEATKKENEDSEGGSEMKHNVFEGSENTQNTISHAEIHELCRVGKQMGSLKAAVEQAVDEEVLQHADGDYGITNIDYLFPDAKAMNTEPEFIKRDMGWVDDVFNGVHRTPFKRVKSIFADITEDEARAKGYIKGKFKKEEVFTLLKRTTDPQTIYKKQKLDKDDLEDLEDNFNVLPWVKNEMNMMFREEVARAILIGDGRPSSSDDKIQENHIRPIYNDEDLFTVKIPVNVAANADEDDIARALIKAMVKARKQYKGTGNPTFFTTEDYLTDCLLIENTLGERIYKSEAEVATAMRASKITTVEPMENKTIAITENGSTTNYPLIGVLVNLTDYNVGAKNGGKTDFFEDFDIDFNQQKYLYEARMSGALKKPFSAVSFYLVEGN
jgi:HK97 family phage prohead protease